VNFDDRVTLLGVTSERVSESELRMSYYWQLVEEAPMAMFVHFTDSDRRILYQNDHALCGGRSISGLRGTYFSETYTVAIPEPWRASDVDVRLGFYDPATSLRLPVKAASSPGWTTTAHGY
jgi:hypothetical protein